jgi:enoyl-CoA hydratase/carnithine racemase
MSLVEVRVGAGWGEIRLNRPEARNALSQALVSDVATALDRLCRESCLVAVIAANGPVFCAGGDLKERLPGPRPSDQLLEALLSTELFVIARVEQPVYGAGVSLVSVCPVILCTPDARFALPEAKQGNFPVPTPYMELAVPKRRLVELGVRATAISAQEAAAMGLVTTLVPPDRLDDEIDGWVAAVNERPAVARQAREYWQAIFRDEAFRQRDAYMRALVASSRRISREGATSRKPDSA